MDLNERSRILDEQKKQLDSYFRELEVQKKVIAEKEKKVREDARNSFYEEHQLKPKSNGSLIGTG